MLLHFNGGRDISRIYLTAQRNRLDFCLSYIASNFAAVRNEPFELACMRALSDYGMHKVLADRAWVASSQTAGALPATADYPAGR